MRNFIQKVKEFFGRVFCKRAKPAPSVEDVIATAKSDGAFFGWFTFAAVLITVAVTLATGIFLIAEAAKLGKADGVFKIFGKSWDIKNEAGVRVFGIFSSLAGSALTVFGALIIGIPLGVLTAVIISRYARGGVKTVLNQANALFAGIPSVVWGFFGIVVLLPVFKNNFEGTGQGEGLLVSILILAFMIIPTIVNITVDSLDAVSGDYSQVSTAMGNTGSQTVFRIVVPAAKRGIIVASILGIGKALGEGIALSMICGNTMVMPKGLFSSFNTMTTLIFSSFASSDSVARQALFAVGVVLFAFIVVINLLVNAAAKERRAGAGQSGIVRFIREKILRLSRAQVKNRTVNMTKKCAERVDFSGRRNSRIWTDIWFCASLAVTVAVFALFVSVIGYILVNGLPLLFGNFGSVFSEYNPLKGGISLLSQIGVTVVMIGLTLVICVPLGILAAVYLCEYADEENPVVKLARFSIQVLSGAPGIIIGLLGYMLFVQSQIFGRGYTLLAGILTMSIMCLPTVEKTVENALKAVPREYIDASSAMGAGKVRTIFRILLPQSLAGIFSAVILCVGKVVAESAALIFTSGTMRSSPSLYGSGATLAVSMYMFARDGRYLSDAYVAGVIIVLVVIAINLIMYFLRRGSAVLKDGAANNSALANKKSKARPA
ncbi:MAG: phosphate ABC transporter permease subunit PstC [Clostridiales bacterium]|jgi:phosphate ABC transporter permease protein PstC/phosphate ABC transporter permease subunit PstA|nr:phosphate ABC transporter permease subunit PstC [Clostridiales bacterium]